MATSECRNPRCENVSEYELCDECFDALLRERGYEKRWVNPNELLYDEPQHAEHFHADLRPPTGRGRMSEHEFTPKSVVVYTGYDSEPASPISLEGMIEEMGGVHLIQLPNGWEAAPSGAFEGDGEEGETIPAAIAALYAAWREREHGS